LATLQEIINFLNRKYPSHGESNANIVLDLDMIHKDIYMQLRRLSNRYDIYEFNTVANQMYYTIPQNFRIEDIEKVMVSVDAQGTTFEEYRLRGLKDDNIDGRFYGRGADGTLFLVYDKKAINKTGLKVHLYYFVRPTDLDSSDLSQVPDLEEDYHDLLKFGIVQEIASQGHNPDIEIANYYQQKFEEKLMKVKSDIENKLQNAPLRIAQQKEWW
jgi:hypothetical protein